MIDPYEQFKRKSRRAVDNGNGNDISYRIAVFIEPLINIFDT